VIVKTGSLEEKMEGGRRGQERREEEREGEG
jgi:hypothetical protein